MRLRGCLLAALFPALASCFAVAGLLQPPDAPALHRRASRPALLAAADSTSALVSTLQNAAARRGEVVVVKFGGHAMSSDELSAQFANDMMVLQRLGLRPVVVHGGGPQINKMLDAVGVKSTFVDGLRVTSPEVMEIAEMVLCGSLNKKIASSINLAGGRAIGLSGKDDTLVSATRKLEPDLGLVGVPSAVRTELLLELLDKGVIPVIAPIATGEAGATYNVNADTMAGCIAGALGAGTLLLLTDVAGVLDGPPPDGKLIPQLTTTEARRLTTDGTASGGMIPKILTAIEAVEYGAKTAVIMDGRVPHCSLVHLFGEGGVGTAVGPRLPAANGG